MFLFTHYAGNRFLTLVTNVLYNTMLTDMETCYKVMRTEVLRSMTLQSDGFGIEPELTAKIFKRALPRLRGADHLRRPRLRRGQEDHLARRLRRAVGAAEVPIHRVNSAPSPASRYARPYRGRFVAAIAAMLRLRRRARPASPRSSSRSSTTCCRSGAGRLARRWLRAGLVWRSTWSRALGAYFSTT